METLPYDLLVIGGGINGAGIARDAAGRGLTVLLVEKDDLAAHTSSWSTKLIHGGLRYLEHYEFRLVAEALAEREVLLHAAPHIIEPLLFVLPHGRHSGRCQYAHTNRRAICRRGSSGRFERRQSVVRQRHYRSVRFRRTCRCRGRGSCAKPRATVSPSARSAPCYRYRDRRRA